MEASQPGKRAGPLSETNVWLVFIWESQPGKRAECFGSNAHARKERAKIAFVNMAPRVKSSLIPAALHVLTAVSLVFQLYGIIIMWKVNELRRNQAVFTDILRKRNYFIQKMIFDQRTWHAQNDNFQPGYRDGVFYMRIFPARLPRSRHRQARSRQAGQPA